MTDITILPITETPRYFWTNSKLFSSLFTPFINTKALCSHPAVKRFISSMASNTDTDYNKLYGGEAVTYDADTWLEHFTDDLWIAAFLATMPPGQELEFIHLGWFLGRLAIITPDGFKPFTESRATIQICYDTDLPWAFTSIREIRLMQFVPFADLAQEQQKEDIIPLTAYIQTKIELGPEAFQEFVQAIDMMFPPFEFSPFIL